MAKLEVQVRHCFCCGLTPGALLIGLYTLFLYALLTGLAAVALTGTDDETNRDYETIYQDCEADALGEDPSKSKKIQFTASGRTTVTMEDTSSYHCSFGMYTEEMKWAAAARSVFLSIALLLYVLLIIASIVLLAGVALSIQWLLVPWLVLLPLDILRGLFSCLFIFMFSHGNLARLATGIFFLGLQFLHISLWIIMLAKFQQIHHRKRERAIYGAGPSPPGHLQRQPYGIYGPGGPAPGEMAAYSPQSGRHFVDEYPHPAPGQPISSSRYYNDGARY